MMMTYLGIDFSGDVYKWKRTVSAARQTVWIAKVRQETAVKVELPATYMIGNRAVTKSI
jgi:hypothetical protein